MKPLKISLRIWIALTSLLSFLGGWILLSHSEKPAPLGSGSSSSPQTNDSNSAAPLPTLQPLPPLDAQLASPNNQIQALPPLSNFSTSNLSPRLRARGS